MRQNRIYLSLFFFIIFFSAASYAQNKAAGSYINSGNDGLKVSPGESDTVAASGKRNLSVFRQRLRELSENIRTRAKDRAELINELDAMMKDEISKDAEFYNKIYVELPEQLHAWASGNYLLYSVKPGDCLWAIASLYKNGNKWPKIYDANKKVIDNPNIIYPAQLLKIPKVIIPNFRDTAETSVVRKPDVDNSIPDSTANDTLTATTVNKNSPENFSLGGMIVDETITKLGHDFYDLFYNNFQVPEGVQDYNINIIEKPQPRLGTMITVKLNDLEIFQGFLQPKYDIIEETAFAALDQCMAYLQNYEAIIKELQGEDMDGNGIY